MSEPSEQTKRLEENARHYVSLGMRTQFEAERQSDNERDLAASRQADALERIATMLAVIAEKMP